MMIISLYLNYLILVRVCTRERYARERKGLKQLCILVWLKKEKCYYKQVFKLFSKKFLRFFS